MFLLWASPPHAGAETLPPDVQAFLADDAPTVEDAAAWQWDDLLGWLAGTATKGLQEPFRFALQAGGYLLLAGVLGLLAGGGSGRRCLDAVAALGFGVLSLDAMMTMSETVLTTARDCQNYLVAFVPVFSGVAAAGGQTAGSLVYSGMFLTMSGFLAGLIQSVLLPVMQIYFCFAACACIWGGAGVAEAASLLARGLQWLLKLCGVVFGAVLGLQNVLANTVDTAMLRTGKSVLQGFIPVVGDAASAALSGAAAAVQLLKGSLALAALLALAAAFVPVFLQCLFYGAAFAAAGAAALAGGQRACGQLCRLYLEGTKLCASILVLYFFMVFLSTALLLITGNGG